MIKYIHHISDIHIRLLKRHNEYRQVFENLYTKIKENVENSIIVVTGDVVHSKTDMSPELVELTSEFFTNLAKLTKVLVIPGNHDCYTPGHQILTTTGWINIEDYVNNNMTHPVATFNQNTKECEFQIPLSNIKKYYEDDVYNISGKDCDITVTKTHQVLYTYSSTKKYYKTTADTLPKRFLIPINSKINLFDEDAYFNLLGFSFAEGTFINAGPNNKKIQFHLKNERGINYLSNILKKLNYNFNVCKQKDDTVYIRIYSDLAGQIYHFFDGKKEIPQTIFENSINKLKSFALGYLNGDGSKNNNFWRFSSISKNSIDILHTIFRLIGGTSHISNRIIFGNYKNSKQQYLCTGNLNNAVNNTSINSKNKSKYSGYVYCVSVPNTNLFIRNNGKICISGNCNLNNTSRLDTLSPILENLKNKNIIYSKATELIEVDNLEFAHQSIFTDKTEYIKPHEMDEDKIKIALYHGVVGGADFGGFLVKDSEMEAKDFDGFDMVMLGDIHGRQRLQFRDAELGKPEIWYAGSILQNNYGEDEDKGYLLWNTQTMVPTFVKVENEYGFHTIEVSQANYEIPERFSKKPRIRLKIHDTSTSDIHRISTDLRKQFEVQELIVNNVDRDVISAKHGKKSGLLDVRNVQVQNKLIREFLESRFGVIDEELLSKIYAINSEANKNLLQNELARNITWIPKRFEFSNMFSYAENNVIDFSKLRGVIGLFAPNASGKSSLIDALMFCIFDRSSRAFKGVNVLNSRKLTFHCKFNFEIDGMDFWIERRGYKQRNGNVKVDVDFWTIGDDGQLLNLNGESRDETNQNIRSYIGTYEDFVTTAMSFQGNNNSFIEKSQTERKDFLAKFLDINIFDELYDMANEKTKEITTLLNEYKKQDFSERLSDLENDFEYNSKQLEKYSHEKEKLEELIFKLNDEILAETQQKVSINSKFVDVERLNQEFEKNKKQIVELIPERDALHDEVVEYKTEAVNLFNEIKKMKEDGVEEGYQTYEMYDAELKRKKPIVEREMIKIEQKKKIIRDLENHEYDPNCKYCVNNVFVKNALQTKIELETELPRFNEMVNDLAVINENLAQTDTWRLLYTKYQRLIRQLEEKKMWAIKKESQKINMTRQIEALELKNLKITEKISEFESNKNAIEHNHIIDKRIDAIKSKLTNVFSNKRDAERRMQESVASVEVSKNEMSKIHELMQNAKEMEQKFQAYELYTKSVSRDGVPYRLIETTMPTLQEEVNDILNQIVDFNILFNLDGKNVNAFIAYDDSRYWPIELVSGMEKFVAGLAIRCALLNICSLSRPTFLAIDEGFGVMDADNISNLTYLFDYLKQKFEFVLIVSHIDTMKDMVDFVLDISRNEGFSKICHE